MAKRSAPKVYHTRNPLKITLKILLAAAAVLVVFALFLFFYFQRFIVYTPEGLKLDIAGYYQTAQEGDPSPSPSQETAE